MKKFPEFGSDYTFALFEEATLAYWNKEKIFDQVLQKGLSQQKKNYYFYDGPPFATGLPHYGHILAGTIKDIAPRYWTQRGMHVARRFGWDCHGLPIEYEMEKTLGLNGSLDILAYGVGKFNESCRSVVLRYAKEWRTVVERMGRWIDMDNDYKTMDAPFMESVWWVFKNLWEKNLIYQGKKVVPYSWRLTAPLSNFEASQNYKEVQDPSIYVLFPLESSKWKESVGVIIWTTTPWTLTANLAVALQTDGEKISYGRYKIAHPLVQSVIIGDFAAEKLELSERLGDVTAEELLGLTYKPALTVFNQNDEPKAFKLIDGSSYVEAGEGTGLVHTAPAHGEVDFYASEKHGIGPRDATDMNGNFTDVVLKDPRLASINGKNFLEANKDIIKVIKDASVLIKHETLQHSYAFCERSDTPLMNKAISSWFVKVEAIKEQMQANNQKIAWVPEHIRSGRFGQWLANARDWCISRNRFWGTPIPVWICAKCDHKEVMGSRADLEARVGQDVPDLHMHFIDDFQFDCSQCSAPKAMKRTSEVLDCWFESGSMPYAQEHYPFENRESFEKNFPADFIAEGLDQTRGWFYTLTVLSTALFNKPAFKNCIVNGIVLAEDGRKMSKRLKNYPDPLEVMGRYGADSMRLYLAQSPAMHGESLRFSEKSLVELMRAVMLPLWNAYGFFASYANIDGWNRDQHFVALDTKNCDPLDEWIAARLKETEILYHQKMEKYELYEVAPILISFIDDLTNWYIRLNRHRFWTSDSLDHDSSKQAAFSTLYRCLGHLSLLMAPILPYFAEYLDGALNQEHVLEWANKAKSETVHAKEFANIPTKLSDSESKVLTKINLATRIILLGRSLRGEAKIGLRQPLQKIRVAGVSPEQKELFLQTRDLILRELNIKDVELADRAADLVTEQAKPNFRTAGKKVGKDMKELQSLLTTWTSEDILAFEKAGAFEFKGVALDTADIEIQRKATDGRLATASKGLVVELDTTLNESLIEEGLKREVVNRIQQRRKEMKLNLADRITITFMVTAGSKLEKILTAEQQSPSFLSNETLAMAWRSGGVEVASEVFEGAGDLAFEVTRVA